MDHNGRVDILDISFAEAFFEDEVREGFFVPTMMKRYWAAQLKVLSVIAGICDRHEIKWFADYGTLMGAVRHGGYIPWDDDLDICMLRSDYVRFFEVAKKELPEGYVIMNIDEQPEYRELVGRVVNSHAIDYSDGHMNEFYGCPYTAGVDIFPLDGVYNDPEKEAERKVRAEKVIAEYTKDHKQESLKRLEKIYSECPISDAEKVALMRFWITDRNHIYSRKLYESFVELPFEDTYIRVPARYDEKLRADYGDYWNVVKVGGAHDYPVYGEQEQILFEHFGRQPYRYSMNNQALLKAVSRYILKASNPSADRTIRKVVFLPCRARWWSSMEPLWEHFSSDPDVEVHVLPIPYNERNYKGEYLDDHDEKDLFPNHVSVEDHEQYDFANEHPDMIVIQVPYDDFSTVMAVPEFYYSHNLQQYTDELLYIPCFDPDDPAVEGDKAEKSISVLIEQPAVVNSDRILLGSDKMKQVYIKKLVELTGEPTREYWNQKIVLPEDFGIFDKTKPVEISSEEWDKFVGNIGGKKVVLYYISISMLLIGGDKAIEKMKRSLHLFAENADNLVAVVLPQKALTDCLKELDDALWEKYKKIVSGIGTVWKNCIYDSCGLTENYIGRCDAFYGDPGVIARKFVINKKPVMIQNLEI
ncbi:MULTISPECIES: LicD family protein [unclassified Butyrivibrio]|uniref:LicD family protein n=1 Tax=unclassified Butyrivibrio TaxID=2639466 RepID=UPI0003B4968E|nr:MULTISPECIES: LicD family protein [unclassified Butyrivibrio]